MRVLGPELRFPPPKQASAEGVVAMGGDLSPERLILAYSQGIFPWPSEGLPLLWFCPDPRFVLPLDALRLPRSLRKTLRRRLVSANGSASPYRVSADTEFAAVIEACSQVPRRGQAGTWITDEMRDGYQTLHELGYAHSIETWEGKELVGGLYGVSLGRVFFGESMFSLRPDASKVAFASLCAYLKAWDFALIDCQVYTDHLARFGACHWPRDLFLSTLRPAVSRPTRKGPWNFTTPPQVLFDSLVVSSEE